MKLGIATSVLLGLTLTTGMANAALITQEFNDGDSLAGWTTDRSEPGSFSIIANELVMEIVDVDPAGTLSGFYDTQGRAFDVGQSNYVSVDMFVDTDTWGASGRFGGFWGVGFDSNDDISAYPILEFQNGSTYVWDSVSPGSWLDYGNAFVDNEFNTLAMQVTSAGVEYSVNGTVLYTDSVSDVDYFGDIILNAKFEGTNYAVRYDNFTYGTVDVSEPSMFALFALGLVGFTRRKFKK